MSGASRARQDESASVEDILSRYPVLPALTRVYLLPPGAHRGRTAFASRGLEAGCISGSFRAGLSRPFDPRPPPNTDAESLGLPAVSSAHQIFGSKRDATFIDT